MKAKEHTGDYDDWLTPDKYTDKEEIAALPKANDLRLGARLSSIRTLNAKLDHIDEDSDGPLPYAYKSTMDTVRSKLSPDSVSADLNHDLTVLANARGASPSPRRASASTRHSPRQRPTAARL